MTHVAIVKDDGTAIDITELVETIFRQGLPTDWEDYTDDDVITSVCQIALLLGAEGGWDQTLADHLLYLERIEAARVENQRRAAKRRAELDQRERDREAKRAETMEFLGNFAQNWLDSTKKTGG